MFMKAYVSSIFKEKNSVAIFKKKKFTMEWLKSEPGA